MTKVIYVQHKRSSWDYATFIALIFAFVTIVALICEMESRKKRCPKLKSSFSKKKIPVISPETAAPSSTKQHPVYSGDAMQVSNSKEMIIGSSTSVSAESFFRHQKPYKKDLPLSNGLWYEVARLDNPLLKHYSNFESEIDSGKFDAEDSFMMKTTSDYKPISILGTLFGKSSSSKKEEKQKRVMKLRVQVVDEEKSELKFYPTKGNLLSMESKVISFNPETHVLVGSVKRGYMVLFSRVPGICGTPLDLGILRERVIGCGFTNEQWQQLLCSYMDRYISSVCEPTFEVVEYMHSLYVQKKWNPDPLKWKKFMDSAIAPVKA